MTRRRIDVCTVGRSDWGIYRPVLRALAARDDVDLRILAGGAHERDGTIADVQRDAVGPVLRLGARAVHDGADVAVVMGEQLAAFAQAFAQQRPDIVVVLGDRYEMFAAASAAVPQLIALAHIHGGERTAGAIDDVLRHGITKMSHLHFVSAPDFARRVQQLGEEPWRITVSGAPAIDDILRAVPVDADEVLERFDVDIRAPFLLCTFHPTTLEAASVNDQVEALLTALSSQELPVVFTGANADAGGQRIRARVQEACAQHRRWRAVESFGGRAWFTVLAAAAVVVGNSSSGIIEAPSFKVPVVNIGTRQDGRPRAANIIDVPADATAITAAIATARSAGFRARLVDVVNPFGDGGAAARIVDVLVRTPIDDRLLRKGFIDWRSP
jgi:UDP-hydrolysing UDP-N-acetyl-D-glucosamine 2-epimerase